MGIGMTIVCSPQQVTKLTAALPQAKIVGEIVKAKGEEKVTIN